jgi:hypothetical protein
MNITRQHTSQCRPMRPMGEVATSFSYRLAIQGGQAALPHSGLYRPPALKSALGFSRHLPQRSSPGGSQIGQKTARVRWPIASVSAFLRTLGIEIAFKREGREGNRIIRMTSRVDFSPSAPSASSATAEPKVCDFGPPR